MLHHCDQVGFLKYDNVKKYAMSNIDIQVLRKETRLCQSYRENILAHICIELQQNKRIYYMIKTQVKSKYEISTNTENMKILFGRNVIQSKASIIRSCILYMYTSLSILTWLRFVFEEVFTNMELEQVNGMWIKLQN